MNDDSQGMHPNGRRRTRRKQGNASESMPLFDFGQHAKTTKAMAHSSARPRQADRRKRIAAYVRSCGARGAHREEIATAMAMPLQSVCSPVLELLREGVLIETPQRRPTKTGSMAAVIIAMEVV